MNKRAKRTFWQLLIDHSVVIPIIQRDYAQGRKGKEFIRKNFLEQIMKSFFANDEKCEMDFVYGTVKDKTLYPIDGQQRLTTLWLFHWYVAWKEGKLNDENIAILKKFTYETRSSSREFCEKLCDFNSKNTPKGKSVVDMIENETWFYSEWKQDPTIQSMCRMLRGTCKTDYKGNPDDSMENFDGIEEVYNSVLWIFHWYIAWKDGKKIEEKTLNQYSRVLRGSLNSFCEELCKNIEMDSAASNLVGEIQKQDWFAEWKQDTSVQSMLSILQVMIDNKTDQLFSNFIFEKLTDESCPLQFSLLEIGTNELPVSDDLYVKMNARGKALTSFENFKAELVDYIHKKALDSANADQADWQKLDKPEDGFGQKLDNAWTDIFWKLRSKDESKIQEHQNHIDEIFFAFFNRFFFNYQASHADSELWKNSPLYGNSGKDETVFFSSLKNYSIPPCREPVDIPLEVFEQISTVLNNWTELANAINKDKNPPLGPSWDEKSFLFLPEYEKNKDKKLLPIIDEDDNDILQITPISVKQRAVFFAVCQWLIENKPLNRDKSQCSFYTSAQKQYFLDWLRVIWNIIENSTTDLADLLIFIDTFLLPGSSNILEYLKELSVDNGTSKKYVIKHNILSSACETSFETATIQLKEEIQKARLFPVWKDYIQKAESSPFLKGRLSVILAASGNNYTAFNTIFDTCKKEICNAQETMIDFFKSYLYWAKDDDLPLYFDTGFFKMDNWKSMFFFNPAKSGVVSWLQSLYADKTKQEMTNWAKNLYDNWDIICPQNNLDEYTRIAKYNHDWGNNKIFFYRTSNITGAQLLSNSLREKLCSDLKSTSSVWHYRGYNFEILLENGIRIIHRPDDTVAVHKDNVWLDAIGDFSLKEPLRPDTLESFYRKLSEIGKEISIE